MAKVVLASVTLAREIMTIVIMKSKTMANRNYGKYIMANETEHEINLFLMRRLE